MIPVAAALKLIDENTGALGAEKVELSASVGRVLAQDIVADSDLPPFDRSQMDGYAVLAADTIDAPVKLEIGGESAAGRGWHKKLKPGEAIRIMTGAPVPKGADAVQRLELAIESDGGRLVEILEPTKPGRFIVNRASETRKGDTIFERGNVITEQMIPALGAFGYASIKVGRAPRAVILGTGSEIVELTKKPGRDQIRNSNTVMLDVLSRRHGASTVTLPVVADEIEKLQKVIKDAARTADLMVMTGGVSVGKYDHTKAALEKVGATIFFEKIRLKPGKPAVFARLGKCLIFGLPGNPVSAAVTFQLFVRRALLIMQGAGAVDLMSGTAVVNSDTSANKERDSYLPARLGSDTSGRLIANVLKFQGSSDFVGFAAADSLVLIPRGQSVTAGETVRVFYL